jgi:hypothetical protein
VIIRGAASRRASSSRTRQSAWVHDTPCCCPWQPHPIRRGSRSDSSWRSFYTKLSTAQPPVKIAKWVFSNDRLWTMANQQHSTLLCSSRVIGDVYLCIFYFNDIEIILLQRYRDQKAGHERPDHGASSTTMRLNGSGLDAFVRGGLDATPCPSQCRSTGTISTRRGRQPPASGSVQTCTPGALNGSSHR